MPAKDGFLLTEGDIDYLRSVYLLRLATIHHLAALSFSSLGQARSYTRTQKRTAKLAAHGYLDVLTRPPRKTLYALGKEGMAALVELGHAPEELLAKRPRHQELKDLFLNHFLLIKNIQVKILLLLRGTSIRLVKWIEGEELYDAVTIQENQGQKSVAVRIPVRPDALKDTCTISSKTSLLKSGDSSFSECSPLLRPPPAPTTCGTICKTSSHLPCARIIFLLVSKRSPSTPSFPKRLLPQPNDN